MSGDHSLVPLTGVERHAAEQLIDMHYELKVCAAVKLVENAQAVLRQAEAAAGDWSASRWLDFREAADVHGALSEAVQAAGFDAAGQGGGLPLYEQEKTGADLVGRYLSDVLGHDLTGGER
ncbi:hypothetical protein [Streptosporangium sp. CA-115845]|uniref:hypothetical protein n=1 Tax=Streptosporangium sp. CA-115845 TaxID=3240071 RepID=UPI003D91785C